MKFDHVIYGTADLDVASARIEAELGLEVLPGGRHVGQGSHNRIVPLGPGYVELLAIVTAPRRRRRRSAGCCSTGSPTTTG